MTSSGLTKDIEAPPHESLLPGPGGKSVVSQLTEADSSPPECPLHGSRLELTRSLTDFRAGGRWNLAWIESYEKVHRIFGRFGRTTLARWRRRGKPGAGGRVNAFIVDRKEETMRSSLARALVATSAIVGIAAGGLAGASASVAATQPVTKPAVSSQRVSPLAVNNLGLDTAHAKNWQSCLNAWGFNAGTEDGQLGTNSWKAAQRMLNAWGYNAGTVDGIVGTNTIRALQNFLNAVGENAGTADGIAGPQTRSAFWNYNATGC